jgi:hypothetical protein
MILVTVEFIDLPVTTSASYNGGFGVHFYNLNEAKLFARSQSEPISGAASDRDSSICRVYNDGILVEAWENGQDITP